MITFGDVSDSSGTLTLEPKDHETTYYVVQLFITTAYI